MVTLQPFISPFLFLLWLLPRGATSTENCPVSTCGGVTVKFPFQLIRNEMFSNNPRCGYPGFQLICNDFLNETIIFMSRDPAGLFIVEDINYEMQTLSIRDPFNCLPKRFIEGFNVRAPFYTDRFRNFTFFDCSSNATKSYERYRSIDCLSSENHTVVAIQSPSMFQDESDLLSSCQKIRTVSVPVPWVFWSGDLEGDVQLTWREPVCGYCELRGQACGFKSETGLEVGCSDLRSSGMSQGTKYGIMIGVGIPGALCIIGFGFFLCGRVRGYGQRRHHPSTELSNVSIAPTPAVVLTGLDGPTIESYPKTLLGESGRLPKPSDNVCPICLCEYQPKETLRTIPECNHYFHANCIDEWLRMNATCPLCRNSPDINGSSASTSSRSSSLLSISP